MTWQFPTLFIRHGNKEPNNPGQGPKIDPELTQKGGLQAIATGRHAAQNYGNLDWENAHIIVSPYKRTIQTAILALAQKDWSVNGAPTLILDPLIGETITDENCVGSKRDVLLEWLIPEKLYENLSNYVERMEYSDEERGRILKNVESLIASLDISAIEGPLNQEWWPKNKDGSYESAADAEARMDKTNEKYCLGPRILFTHSTFIADVMNKIRPSAAFSAQETEPEIAAGLNQQFTGAAQWVASKHIPEAGLFEVQSAANTNKPAVTHAFDPSLALEAV